MNAAECINKQQLANNKSYYSQSISQLVDKVLINN